MRLKLLLLSLLLISCNTIDPNSKHGCLDSQACNYDSEATIDNNSCYYTIACDSICGGTAELDECGVCGGSVTDIANCDNVYGECPDGMILGCNGTCDSSPSVVGECGVCGGSGILDGACDCAGNVADCAGDCGGNAVEDACGVCGGDGSTCEAVDGMWIIYFNTSTPIGGFQFEVEGVTVDDVSDGAAEDAGFMVSTGNNTVIGFSFSGSTVPVGEGILVVLDVTGSGDACIVEESLIISDAIGVALSAGAENCNTIHIP